MRASDSPGQAPGPRSFPPSIATESREAAVAALLRHPATDLSQHPVTLAFRDAGVEGQFVAEVSASRWPVLLFIFVFDCLVYALRLAVGAAVGTAVARDLGAQLLNMAVLYTLMGLLNRRSRTSRSPQAAKQEECLLALIMALAISVLLLALKPDSRDYVYAAFFLVCATPLLKIRWLVGTALLAAPVALAAGVHFSARCGAAALAAGGAAAGEAACSSADAPGAGPLPLEAVIHLLVAWAVGGLMAFLSDTNRRQAFAHHALALAAAEKELAEMRARAGVERELAAAQAQAAARALVVAREKASNEAKSEFMSLMCHEVRTPLNGCLASAEMLLETELTAEQHDLARTIRVSGSILLSTVSNFLDFFKIEAGKQLDIVRTPLDLRDLVADVHCIIEAMLGRDGAVALLEPDLGDVPTTVMGDPNRVCGVLLNLYTNAAKFTKQGAIGLRVRVVGKGYRPDVASAKNFLHTALGGAAGSPRPSDGDADTSLSSSLGSASSGSGELPALTAGGAAAAGPPRRSEAVGSGGAARGLRREDDTLQEAGGAGGYSAQPRPSLQYESQWRSPNMTASGHSQGSDGDDSAGDGGGGHMGAPLAHQQPRRSGVGSRLGSRRGSKLTTPGAPSPYGTAGFMRNSAEFDSAQSLPAAALLAKHAEEEGCPTDSGLNLMELAHLGDGWSSVCSQPTDPGCEAAVAGGRSAPAAAGGSGRQWLAFEVQDTGVGVASRGMDSLFQDYVQGTDLEMRRARSRGGTGLGLSICSKQVAVLGGQIGALSKPNCGSVFWFTIPLHVPPGAAAAAAPTAIPQAPAARGTGCGEPSSPQPRRPSLEQELAQLWGSPSGAGSRRAGPADSAARRLSLAMPAPAGEGVAGPGRCSVDAAAHTSHGNSFGWYHLPPTSGATARTSAANRLRVPPPASPDSTTGGTAGSDGSPRAASAAAQRGLGQLAEEPSIGGAAAPAAAAAAAAQPLVPDAGRTTSASTANPKPVAAPQQYAHAGRGYGLWVLLAEDNLINQTVARKMLSALGMKCQVAVNGREAVEAVQSAHQSGMNYDVVLMDMCMPVLSGVDATKAIRQLGCATPIVAMTANASERDRQECLAAGMNGFLSKPVLKDKLLEAILTATQR